MSRHRTGRVQQSIPESGVAKTTAVPQTPTASRGFPTLEAVVAREVPQEQLAPCVHPDDLVALNESTGLYERLPMANAVVAPPAAAADINVGDLVTFDKERNQYVPLPPLSSSCSGPSVVSPMATPRTSANARRIAAAHAHLDRMFEDAEAEQICGRRFWGSIVLEIPFQEGEAGDILASKSARDRCNGGRAA